MENLIEITNGENILGYECAYGLECLQWAIENKPSIFDIYPIFNYFNKNDTNTVKIIDTAMSIAAIESVGIEPTNKTARGQIIKKLYRNLVYLSEKNNFNDKNITEIMNILSDTEFDQDINTDKILTHFHQSKTLVNCQRNAFLTRKKELCDMYKKGIITIKDAERKMLSWAEGKYYIDRHERAKYFDLETNPNKQSQSNNPIKQSNFDER